MIDVKEIWLRVDDLPRTQIWRGFRDRSREHVCDHVWDQIWINHRALFARLRFRRQHYIKFDEYI